MIIENMFKQDINRPINGVIQVNQEDPECIKQELSEYVITKELRKHFATFLNNYEYSIDTPTDKVGVWISGFFGSGKSHFLKILSYILENKPVCGKNAIEYLEDKFDDPLLFSQLEKCVQVPTETILFNIDRIGSIEKTSTVILRIFAKVFYEHQGFYGQDLKVAKFEQYLSRQGKYDEFKQEFKRINGDDWEETRDTFSFIADDIVDAMKTVFGMSEESARNWVNSEENVDFSIDQLVKEIKEYVDSKGSDYRLLFMIDEVGQYIGSDSNMMLNLQTIVEELGTQCGGRVWVMVTSQEAVDTIVKLVGNDFSKIMGRFPTRLSLTSSSVDEVIKKRILAKNELASDLLQLKYQENENILRSLLTFDTSNKSAVSDMKGYGSEVEYIDAYPFVPYQFKLMQNILIKTSQASISGQHQSRGERSMLSGFQETAQKMQGKDENALVPFYMFYDAMYTFFDTADRTVIERCQTAADEGNGIEQIDVQILKLLYLLKNVQDIRANVENISTLMVDNINADKISMRIEIQNSLDRLFGQNYIARNGDYYSFLTNEEQQITAAVKRENVTNPDIVKKVLDIVYGELYSYKKFKYDKCDFPYDQFVDNVPAGIITGGMILRILTVDSEEYNAGDQALTHRSTNNEAIIRLTDDYPYFNELELALKIKSYIKHRNISQLPESTQRIIRDMQVNANNYEKRAKEMIEKAIIEGSVYVAGTRLEDKSTSVKTKIDNALEYLVESVYLKMNYINKSADSDSEIYAVLSDKQAAMDGAGCPNQEALDDVMLYLQIREEQMRSTTMGDIQRKYQGIPYGWREIDIAVVIAQLIKYQKVQISYSGTLIQPDNRKIPDYLRKKTEIDKTNVSRRNPPDTKVIENARSVLKEFFNIMDVPSDEDGLISFVNTRFDQYKIELEDLKKNYAMGNYPGEQIVTDGIELVKGILSQNKDNTALLKAVSSKEDDLLDLGEDITDVKTFFKNQRKIFDQAKALSDKMKAEYDYIKNDAKAVEALQEIDTILAMPKPYKRISELPTYMLTVDTAYDELLNMKREEVYEDINSALAEIKSVAGASKEKIDVAEGEFNSKVTQATDTKTITALDAMKPKIQSLKQQYISSIMKASGNTETKVNSRTASRTTVFSPVKLTSEADIDEYLSKLKQKLMDEIDGYDELHLV